MNTSTKQTLELIAESRPIVRTIAAFAVYLRFGSFNSFQSIEDCYTSADKFLDRMVADVKEYCGE